MANMYIKKPVPSLCEAFETFLDRYGMSLFVDTYGVSVRVRMRDCHNTFAVHTN